MSPKVYPQVLYRGTSTKFVHGTELVNHPWKGKRASYGSLMYFSERVEWAELYACLTAESYGGDPLIIRIEVSPELKKVLYQGRVEEDEFYIVAQSAKFRNFTYQKVPRDRCATKYYTFPQKSNTKP